MYDVQEDNSQNNPKEHISMHKRYIHAIADTVLFYDARCLQMWYISALDNIGKPWEVESILRLSL